MKVKLSWIVFGALITEALGSLQNERRAAPVAPNGYIPQAGPCPSSRPTVRSASGLSDSETTWLKARRKVIAQDFPNFLNFLNITGFNASDYAGRFFGNTSNIPNIGLAFSGYEVFQLRTRNNTDLFRGGYRAALTGAGAIEAWDARIGTNDSHSIPGLLNAATYIAGSSGGGWLVSSLFVSNETLREMYMH